MTEKFFSAIRQYNMLQSGDTVTVALSGGADSVALLHLLFSQREALDISVRAAHLNHNLRGAESDRDERFVRELCEGLNIPLEVKSVDVAALALHSGDSIELAARKARYDFFGSLGGKIATAHTASDNAETVLFNLARGTGIKGIGGIPAVRDCYIRPLKFCTRADVEKYCADNDLAFVTDSTNLSDDYTRNRLRHNVVPLLREINPSFESAVLRLSKTAAEDNDYIETQARDFFSSAFADNKILLPDNMHIALLSRVVALLIYKVTGKNADSEHISDICHSLGCSKRISIQGGYEALINGREVRIVPLGYTQAAEYYVSYRVLSKENFESELKINKLLLKNAIDCDKIADKVTLRTRAEGDSIKLCGRGTKSLKKLYNEEHIPLDERAVLPVAADSLGVVWICGVGAAQRTRIDKNTKSVIIFDVIKQ